MTSNEHAKLAFQGMASEGWMRLGCAALLICYLLQIGFEVLWRNTCGHLAIDYCAFWSAGHIANTLGYVQMYDLSVLKPVETSISPGGAFYPFVVSPIAYLPVFMVPFQLLNRLNPVESYWLWAIANLLVLALYLRFFARQTALQLTPTMLALCLLSLPVYWNLFNGQVNVWLVVCIGEALRANLAARYFRCGLWLAGLALKPQLLVLIVLVMLLQRAWQILGGLAVGVASILGASWLMVGARGFERIIELWIGFGKGLPTNDVDIMMNWRMLGSTLTGLGLPLVGWILILVGSAATIAGTLYLWRGHIRFQSEDSVICWMGLLAATTIIMWHSHVHTAMILLPSMLFLVGRKRLSEKVLALWSILPGAFYFAAFFTAAAIQARVLPTSAGMFVDFSRGGGALGMSIYLMVWAMDASANTGLSLQKAAEAARTNG